MRLVPGKWQKKSVSMKGLISNKGQKKLVLPMEIKSGNGHKELIFLGIGLMFNTKKWKFDFKM